MLIAHNVGSDRGRATVVELHVERRPTGGRGGLITKTTKGRRRQTVPIIEPLRPTLDRVTVGRDQDERLIIGPRGGVTTATRAAPADLGLTVSKR